MNVTTVDNQAINTASAAKNILKVPVDGFGVCPVRDILDHIGSKWALLTILHLGTTETIRFNELRHRIDGISQRMLTVTLRSLQTDGFVKRTVYAEVPPRVDYQLTPLGHSLLTAVIELGNWAQTHLPAIVEARRINGGQ